MFLKKKKKKNHIGPGTGIADYLHIKLSINATIKNDNTNNDNNVNNDDNITICLRIYIHKHTRYWGQSGTLLMVSNKLGTENYPAWARAVFLS